MNNKTTGFATLRESYKISQEIAGEHAGVFRRSTQLFLIAFFAEGAAYACFYPFMANVFSGADSKAAAFSWLGVMTLCLAVYAAARWHGHAVDFSGIAAEITHGLRLKLGQKIRTMPLEKLYKYRTGELNSIFAGSVEESVLQFGAVTSLIIQVLVVPVVIVGATFFADWRLALVILLIFPLGIPAYRKKRQASAEDKCCISSAHSTAEADIVEYTQGLFVLRALNLAGSKSKHLQNSFAALRNAQRKAELKGILPSVAISSLVHAAILALAGAGIYLIIGGTLTLPVLAALLVITARLLEPIEMFSSVASVIDITNTAFARIKSLMKTEELPVMIPAQKPADSAVSFDEVDFTYSGERDKALNNISIKIPAGSLTAVVGESGSGKTTLTKMIMRFADPQKGQITIGGADIKAMTQAELMKNISVVFQDVYLFDDSILNNIRMGRQDAPYSEVQAAAKAANCDDFINRLPNGYLTRVGDIGGSLSGGERQRISIARAILKNAPIVILDEPTAALDTESETAVQAAVDSLVKNRTVIVIAHRLSTISGADNIIVMDNGGVAEHGTHEQLIKNGGRYASMWNAQQRIKKWNKTV